MMGNLCCSWIQDSLQLSVAETSTICKSTMFHIYPKSRSAPLPVIYRNPGIHALRSSQIFHVLVFTCLLGFEQADSRPCKRFLSMIWGWATSNRQTHSLHGNLHVETFWQAGRATRMLGQQVGWRVHIMIWAFSIEQRFLKKFKLL